MNIFTKIHQTWKQWRLKLGRRSYYLSGIAHVGAVVVIAFGLVLIFTLSILQPYRVSGNSMSPTLQNGDRLFVLRLGKIFASLTGTDYVPKRGEIVVFHSALKDNKWIKRVVGLPGERIVIRDNEITIYNQEFPNGFKPQFDFDLPLLDFPSSEPIIDRIIGRGEIFVLGDNRQPQASSDSRGSLGNISTDDIDGTVAIRVVPIFDFKFFF